MSISGKFFGGAALAFMVLLSAPSIAEDHGNAWKKNNIFTLSKSDPVQDTIKKTAKPGKPVSKKPDTRSIQEKLRDTRSSIKQVPRSVPKLKPQPVKEQITIRTNNSRSTPEKKGSKGSPF